MTIDSPLARYSYLLGELIQCCDDCDWAQAGHRKELADCPECGARLGAPLAIQFGGTTVIFDGRRFDLHSSLGGVVTIAAADYPDIVAFLCRHGSDYRPADGYDAANVRRVLKTRDFDRMCLELWRS